MNTKDELIFAPETEETAFRNAPWKILIADDEQEVHEVTKLALNGFHLNGRFIQFLDAYSGRESVELMHQHPDIALILMDVVMESENAGLDAVNEIRGFNPAVRVVLRTGQPGQAPERDVVTRYDINDYKEKTELTAKKLFTVVYTNLNQYQEICALQGSRGKMQQVLEAIKRFPEHSGIYTFAHCVLEELSTLIDGAPSATNNFPGIAVKMDPPDMAPLLLANTGRHVGVLGLPFSDNAILHYIEKLPNQTFSNGGDYFAMTIETQDGSRTVYFLAINTAVDHLDSNAMDLFADSVRIAMESLQFTTDVRQTDNQAVFMLSQAIEIRSHQSSNRGQRVAEYSRLLAKLYGLSDADIQMLYLAAPLLDAGKLGIPDQILNKPGALTPEETAIMRTHVEIGERMLSKMNLRTLKAAAIIVGQHHERWNGLGYPRRLAGEDIHIYGRIVALADVFDAIGSDRCYRQAWPVETMVQMIRDERGKHFDPKLVDLLMDHLDQFMAIRERLKDSA